MAKAEKERKEKKLPFEAALKRLEEIVADLESGDLPLEEALSRFEEGTRLVRQAGEQLSAAEKKMELLRKDQDGRVTGAGTLDDLPGQDEGGDGPR